MNTTIKLTHVDNEHSQHWLQQKAWAEGILAQPSVTFPNGKQSHNVAHFVLEEAEIELIEDLAIQVTA